LCVSTLIVEFKSSLTNEYSLVSFRVSRSALVPLTIAALSLYAEIIPSGEALLVSLIKSKRVLFF
jgi:hypothetical protein